MGSNISPLSDDDVFRQRQKTRSRRQAISKAGARWPAVAEISLILRHGWPLKPATGPVIGQVSDNVLVSQQPVAGPLQHISPGQA
jgi:hypothetical protein